MVKDNAIEEIKKLKQQSGKDMSIAGLSFTQELERQGLIDEYLFLLQPVVKGNGKRFVRRFRDKINFKLIETKAFKSGVVVLHNSFKKRCYILRPANKSASLPVSYTLHECAGGKSLAFLNETRKG